MLRDDQNARIQVMLENLETVLDNLEPRPKDFVTQTIDRYATYGQRLMFSERQWQWLEDIHSQYCPNAPDLPPLDDPDPAPQQQSRGGQLKRKQPVGNRLSNDQDDMDDEVPF